MLDVSISSTAQIARSWGLVASFEKRPDQARDLTLPPFQSARSRIADEWNTEDHQRRFAGGRADEVVILATAPCEISGEISMQNYR